MNADPDFINPTQPPFVELQPGEANLHTWTPQLRYFLYKAAFVSGLTSVCLGGIAQVSLDLSGLVIWISSVVIGVVFYAFLFDDYLEWRARRDDVWVLTSQRLVFYNPKDDGMPVEMPLERILKVGTWMFWGVRVRLIPRDQIMMQFLPDRPAVRDAISSARSDRVKVLQQQGMTS